MIALFLAILLAADWYAVAWDQQADTLHWLTATGEQAAISRPHLPDEAGNIQLAISTDGETLIITALLTNGRQGIGFYDLASGEFLQIHQAEIGETIQSSMGRDDYFAVLLSSWRIIIFDTQTGDAHYQLTANSPIAVSITPQQMIYFGEDTVYFDSYAWNFIEGSLAPSDYETDMDILYSTGEATMTFTNRAYRALTDDANAIGRGTIANPRTVFISENNAVSDATWVAGGAWIAYHTADSWHVTFADGEPLTNRQVATSPDVMTIIGTPTGYLSQTSTHEIYHTTDFNTWDETLLFSGDAQIIYVTPENVEFTLSEIAEVTITATPDAIPVCADAPPAQVIPGTQATVTSPVPLRIRTFPGGDYVNEMPSGAIFTLMNTMPICQDGFLWWNVSWTSPEGTYYAGWSAEGDPQQYYMATIP